MAIAAKVGVGHKYGQLTVLKHVGNHPERQYLVHCSCGSKPFVTSGSRLTQARTWRCRQCGLDASIKARRERRWSTKSKKGEHHMRKSKIEIGKEYGHLTAIRDRGLDKRQNRIYDFRCRCGNEHHRIGSTVLSGKSWRCLQCANKAAGLARTKRPSKMPPFVSPARPEPSPIPLVAAPRFVRLRRVLA
jgi:predicted SprT family Zn-dependent metalloprotease